MKVAMVCPYALDRHGGVQGQSIELTRRLRELGHQVSLVAPGRTGPDEAHLVGPTVAVPVNRSVAPVALHPQSGLRALRAVREAELAHIHEPFVPLVSLAALFANLPKVGTFHAAPSPRVRRLYRFGRPVFRAWASRLEVATAVSGVAAEAVSGLARGPRLVPNGLDTAAYVVQVPRDPRRVTFLGRDEPRKGLALLLAVWPLVREAVADAELVVIGAARSGPTPSGVRFLGALQEADKRAELARSSLLCAPNLGEESFGITVLEGMAAGCAVVASSLPAFREVLDQAGFLVAPGDGRALTAALVELLKEPKRAAEAGELGRERAARFDWQAVLPAYLDAYREAIG